MLITQMMRDMRRAMVADADTERSEFDALSGTLDAEVGRALSASGGFGLSATLLGALEKLANPQAAGSADGASSRVVSGATVPQAHAGGAPSRGVSPATVARALVDVGSASDSAGEPEATGAGAVTSGFGWRRDPLTGARGFHSGVDLRMAYGLDVRSVAEGHVRFAGEQGAYGTMVSVLHTDGRETRYAHLAESLVRAGDAVQAGQVLGRSGSSGRATGPHLHFEVLMDGQRVDPMGSQASEREGRGGE